jgi:hypothetical protein
MSKKKVILILSLVMVLVLAVTGIYFFVSQQNGKQPASQRAGNEQEVDLQDTSTTETDISEVNGNVFDLLKIGNSVKCTFSTEDESGLTSGVTYVADNQVRGDFEVNLGEDGPIQSHIISDGQWIYMWSSALPQGIKANIEDTDLQKTTEEAANSKDLKAFQNNVNYKCSSWNKDESKFVIPQDVKFLDMSQTLKELKVDPDNLCSACDYIPDEEAKSECKTRMNCQ